MKNIIYENNFISTFSSSVIGNGKKVCGHKIFLQSLFIARQLQKKKRGESELNKEQENKSFFDFLILIGFSLQKIKEFIKSGKKSYLREQDYNNYIKLQQVDVHAESTTNIKSLKITKPKKSPSKNKIKLDKKKQEKAFLTTTQTKVENSNTLKKENDNKSEKENVVLQNKAFQNTNKSFFDNSICNIKPILEVRKVRKGRMTYRVPLVTQPDRQEGRAIAWIIKSACNTKRKKEKKENHFSISSENLFIEKPQFLKSFEKEKKNSRNIESCLAQELINACNKKGESFEKKKESHRIALQNRAYTHYRWW